MVRVRGAGGGRVSIAGVACCRPGDRPHLFYHLLAYRRRKGEAKGFSWLDYRNLIIATMVNFAAADVDGLVRIIKRKLKKIQYRPYLIDGCLAATGLKLEPWTRRSAQLGREPPCH